MTMAAAMSVDMFLLAAFVKIGSKGTGIAAAVCIFLYQSFYTWGWVGLLLSRFLGCRCGAGDMAGGRCVRADERGDSVLLGRGLLMATEAGAV